MAKNFPLRMPEDLAQEVAVVASAEGHSMNATVVEALREAIERRRQDPEFIARLKALRDANKEILDRLAGQ
jgi:hypothetical protein